MNSSNSKTNSEKAHGPSSSQGDQNSASTASSTSSKAPQIVTGFHYAQFAFENTDRYAYIGKDDAGEPEFLDYGPKSARK